MRLLSSSFIAQYDFTPLVEGLGNAVKKMTDAVTSDTTQNMISFLKQVSINMSAITEGFKMPSETIEAMRKLAGTIAIESQDYRLSLEPIDDAELEQPDLDIADNNNDMRDNDNNNNNNNNNIEDSEETGDEEMGND